MIRAALLLGVLAAIAAIAVWFADTPGDVAIDWGGWHVETSVGVAVGSVVLFAVVVALLYRVWRWLRTMPGRMRERQEQQRRMQGYRALTRGMVAVAAGDGEESRRLARRAEALLEEPPLTLLLSAQAAQLNGDERAAEKYFQAMLGNPELEFLGLRGLLTSELRQGATAAALDHARRAYRLRPQSDWIQNTLFELQLGQAQWKQAEALLQDVAKRGTAPEATVRRRRAILLLEQAAEVETAGDRTAAAQLAERAHHAAHDFVPAAVAAARLLGATGKDKRAARVIETTWRYSPHPDLAASLAALFADEPPARRVARARHLGDLAVGHVEGQIALARAAIDAADWPLARKTLEAIGGDPPEARVCRLWAELEDAEHGPGLASREWLMRAASAPADPTWTCNKCGQGAIAWRATCPNCGAFDSLRWQRTKASAEAPLLEAKAMVGAAALARPEAPRKLAAPGAPVARAAPPLAQGNGATAPGKDSAPGITPTSLPLPPDVPAIEPSNERRSPR